MTEQNTEGITEVFKHLQRHNDGNDNYTVTSAPFTVTPGGGYTPYLGQQEVMSILGAIKSFLEEPSKLLPEELLGGKLDISKHKDGRFYVQWLREDGSNTFSIKGTPAPGSSCGGGTAMDAVLFAVYWLWFGDYIPNIEFKAWADCLKLLDIEYGGVEKIIWNDDGSYVIPTEENTARESEKG